MPKIPVMTAQGQGTLLRLPAANAEALGGQAGRATIGFGQTLQQIDQAIQAQRDEIDYAEKAAQFDLQVADETRKLLDDRTLDDQKKPQLLQDRMREIRRTVMGESSQHVAQALMIHEQRALPTTMIHFQTEMRQRSIAQTEVDFVDTLNKRADAAALNPEMATQALTEVTDLAERAKTHQVMSVPFITKAKADAMDRYWSQVAMNRPEDIFAIAAEVAASGTPPAGMDLGKIRHYEEIAVHAQSRINSQLNAAEKKAEAERKAQSQTVVAEYFSRSALPNHDPQSLLEEAARDPRLSSTDKPEAVRYLQSRADHAASAAKNGTKFDERFFLRTLLPNIWNGKYKDELDVLKAGGDHLDASHATQAIEQFHKYNTTVTAPVKQAFQFGEDVIRQAFALPPGATIDAAGVGDAKGRAMDRFTTWYGDLVQRAATEGPKVFDGLDIQAQARKFKDEELVALDDNVIRILETKPPQYKSEEEIRKAYEGGKIASTREVNRALAELESYQHLQQRAAKRTKANPSDKRIEK